MNIINVLKLTFSQIYNRRYIFLLSMLIIGVMFFYLDFMTYQSFEQYYQVWKAEDALADKGKEVYSLEFDDINFVETNAGKAKEFYEKVKEKYDMAGGFYITSIFSERLTKMTLEELMQPAADATFDELMQVGTDMLIVDENIVKLCEVSLENGVAINEMEQAAHDGNIPVIMGNNYKGQFNQGETFTIYLSDDIYEVAGFLEKGSEWISDSLFFSLESVLSLDNCLMVCKDDKFTKKELSLARNNFYIISDMGKEKLEKEIEGIAENMDISVSVSSFHDLVLEYKKENARAMRLAEIILFTGLIVVALTTVLNSVMAVIARKKEYIVMNVCGVSFKDIFKMLCMENIIKMVIPFEAAVLLMNQISYYHNKYRSDYYMYIQNRAVLVMLLYMLLLLILCSAASVRYLKSADINKAGGMFDD